MTCGPLRGACLLMKFGMPKEGQSVEVVAPWIRSRAVGCLATKLEPVLVDGCQFKIYKHTSHFIIQGVWCWHIDKLTCYFHFVMSSDIGAPLMLCETTGLALKVIK